LGDQIALAITPELLNEINRNENAHIRKKHQESAQTYLQIKDNESEFHSIYSQLTGSWMRLSPQGVGKDLCEQDLTQGKNRIGQP